MTPVQLVSNEPGDIHVVDDQVADEPRDADPAQVAVQEPGPAHVGYVNAGASELSAAQALACLEPVRSELRRRHLVCHAPHELTAYDAAYLVLAEREGVPLATLDTKLRSACQAVGVRLIPEV